MKLCFGIYATILYKCSNNGVNQQELIAGLVETIDKDHRYRGERSNVNPVLSRLMNCKANFPCVAAKNNAESNNNSGDNFASNASSGSGTYTNIVNLARNIKAEQLKLEFESVISLLDQDRKPIAASAVIDVIQNDKSLYNERKETFQRCFGVYPAEVCSLEKGIDFEFLLAASFLYTILTNDNIAGSEYIELVKKDSYYIELSKKAENMKKLLKMCSQGISADSKIPAVSPAEEDFF